MRYEDLGKFMDEAFEKLEPQNDAHREKLAELRDKVKEIDRSGAEEFAKLQNEIAEMREDRLLSKETTRRTVSTIQETWDAFLDGADEQTALIERIVKATQSRRSSS